MDDDLICVQFKEGGKWHVKLPGNEAACSGPYAPQEGATYRYLSLIDSKDRCRHTACVLERNRAAGRV